MELDSVRSLKQALLASEIEPLGRLVTKRAVGAKATGDVDNVQRSVALGIAHRGGKDFKLAIRVQNRILENSDEIARIRAAARGEVDERYIGRVEKQAAAPLRSRQRPLVLGCSIGHFDITAGTLGCFVRTASGGQRILSNNHVLAKENQARKGDAVISPGHNDGGRRPGDVIGAVDSFVRLLKSKPNRIDAALATVNSKVEVDTASLAELGRLRGVSSEPLTVGMRAHKVGRTTGKTTGRVTAFEIDDLVVHYDMGNLRFRNQIEIEGAVDLPFSQLGDSGSLIVDEELRAVALLFAASDVGGSNQKGVTFAHPIGEVFSALDVTLLL